MRIVVLALALIPAAALAQERPVSPVKWPACDPAPQTMAKGWLRNPHTLKDEPRAEAYLTVLRIENGCERPVKTSEYRRSRR